MGLIFFLLVLGFCDLAFAGDGSRTFLKAGAGVGAILGIVGISIGGYFSGKSYDSGGY